MRGDWAGGVGNKTGGWTGPGACSVMGICKPVEGVACGNAGAPINKTFSILFILECGCLFVCFVVVVVVFFAMLQYLDPFLSGVFEIN